MGSVNCDASSTSASENDEFPNISKVDAIQVVPKIYNFMS